MSNVAVSWTGGKDSSLTLYETEKLGCKISCLVTFVPRRDKILAHPLNFIKLQSQALDIPHYAVPVEEPFDRSYENAIASLKEQHGVDALATGDIAEVAGHDPNWIVVRAMHCGIDVVRPLWNQDRLELLSRLLALRFRIIFSCVKSPWFTDDWLGLELSPSLVEQLGELSARTGLDICGEQGEYHTLTLDGPNFKKSILIESYSKHIDGQVMYLAFGSLRLAEKHTQR
jgi:diphthine-ammonia ligase